MLWMRKRITPLRIVLGLLLLLILLILPFASGWWILRNAHANGPDLSSLPRLKSATSIFGSHPSGSTTSKSARPIRPDAVLPGRLLPGLSGHAARNTSHTVSRASTIHTNTAFASNVVVSSDATEPRNGPQAAADPTNVNRLLVAFNDYTANQQGARYTAGYSISTDAGASWSQTQDVHGLLKIDGGPYDGVSDPGVVFDGGGNAYLAATAFNDDDWMTGVYVAKMAAGSSQFGTPVRVVAYNDTHHVVEYARMAAGVAGNTNLYLTFNVLSASPLAPNAPLAANWTSQLYFTSSSNGGSTWSTPAAIGTGPQDYWGVPVVGWNNTVYVFYASASGLEMVQSSNNGQTWTAPRFLQNISIVGEQRGPNGVYINSGPDAAADIGSHTLYVVYDGGKVTISNDNGTTWSNPLDVLGSRFEPAYLASIGVDPNTHTVSVGGYSSMNDASGNSYNYYYAQSSDGGNHFSSPILISNNVSLPPAPAFGSIGRASSVVGAGSKAHLFWTDTNGPGGNEQIVSAAVDVSQPMMGALQSSWDSGQTLAPWGLVFTASGSQTIGVGDYGQGSISNLNISTSGGKWLSASSPSGTCPCVVTVTVTAGASNATSSVTISTTGSLNNSITIPVQLLVTAPTHGYALSSNSLSFTALQGVDPPPQGIEMNSLSNTNEMLQINTNNDTALNVYSPGGPQNNLLKPGTQAGFIVQIVTAGLPSGASTHSLTVSDGTTTQMVTIHVTINAAPAQLDDPGSTLSFDYHLQGTAPRTQSLPLHNSGGSTLNWQAQTDAAWLTLGATSGTLAAGATQQLSVGVNVSSAANVGTYIGHVILGGDSQAQNLPKVVTVYLVVGQSTSQVSTTWYFAEGFVSPNFTEFLTLENPSKTSTAAVSVTYLTQPVGQSSRSPFVLNYTVKPNSRNTVLVNSQPGIVQNDQISMVVNSSIPIVAERPMYFKYTLLTPNPDGGTDVLGATHQGSVFFFPFVQFGDDQQVNSPTYGTNYITYLTVLNRNASAVNVAVTYKGADSLYTVTHSVAANTRGTINLAGDFPFASSSNNSSYLYAESLMVTTDLPVVVELPSYFTIPSGSTHIAFASGTDEVGATAPQTNWNFAEGFTGSNTEQFLTYLDLANPGNTPANATLTLAVTNGSNSLAPVTKQYTIAPQSSISVWLNPLVCPQGLIYCGYAIGEHIASSQPVVVDRQMFFNYRGSIPGSTAVVGSRGPQSQFYFAEGYTGSGFNEYLTIVNPATNSSAETVTIRYLIQGGSSKTVTLPQPLQPNSRWTENVNNDVGANAQVSVVVSTNVGTLIVERPEYFNFHAMAAGGTDVIGYSPGD